MHDGPKPRRLERDSNNKMIAGVAAGVANYFDLDPTIVRVLWAASFLFGGVGAIVYVIMWIVVPESGATPTSDAPPAGGAAPTEQAADGPTEHAEPASEEPRTAPRATDLGEGNHVEAERPGSTGSRSPAVYRVLVAAAGVDSIVSRSLSPRPNTSGKNDSSTSGGATK